MNAGQAHRSGGAHGQVKPELVTLRLRLRLVRRHRRLLAGAGRGRHPSPPSGWPCSHRPRPPATSSWRPRTCRRDSPWSPGDLAVAQVPAGVLPAGTSSDPGDFLGRALAAPMARGEALAGHRLTDLPAVGGAPGHDAPARAVRRCRGSGARCPLGSAWTWSPPLGPGSTARHRSPPPSWSPRTSSCWRSSPRSQGSGGILGGHATAEEQSPAGDARRRPGSGSGDRRRAGAREPELPDAPRPRLTAASGLPTGAGASEPPAAPGGQALGPDPGGAPRGARLASSARMPLSSSTTSVSSRTSSGLGLLGCDMPGRVRPCSSARRRRSTPRPSDHEGHERGEDRSELDDSAPIDRAGSAPGRSSACRTGWP